MPQYLYKCEPCNTRRYVHRSVADPRIVYCERCGEIMQKRPIAVAVNWQGNKPSDGGVTDLVQHMIADAPRQRDELAAKKEVDNASI